MQTKPDPAIAEIRATRHKISKEFGHDPQRIISYYIKLQQKQEELRQQQKQSVTAKALELSKI